MKKLQRTESDVFENYYSGANGGRRVYCILDDCCVRYTVLENGKKVSCRCYNNAQKALCFARAERALNK